MYPALPFRLCIYHKQFYSVKFRAMNSDEKVFIKCVNPVDDTPILAYNIITVRKRAKQRRTFDEQL